MINNLTSFKFKNNSVRTTEKDGLIWFVASDIAKALKYRTANDLTRVLDDDERDTHIMRTQSGKQEMLIINESGMYHSIIKSRKPAAKLFRKWVTSEVLPSIRRTGKYEMPRPSYLDEIYTLLCEKFPNGIDRPYAWGRFNKHFRISSYKNLPIERFNEAKEYISNIPPRPIAISAPNETLAEQINRLLASVKEISIKEKESIQKSFIANIGMPKQYFDVGFAGVFDTATCQFRSFGHRAKQVKGIFDN